MQRCRSVTIGSLSLAISLAFGVGARASALADAPPDYASVATLAGSGRAGIADGSATAAEFMMPTSVAEDASGNVYVVDYAGERIREISRDGNVRTIAGGGEIDRTGLFVPGGLVNGPAAQSRFYTPIGIAVDSRGTVYVADSGVHVVRRIKDGVVSTYAGNSDRGGDKLGPALGGALFERPVGLALDSDGDLYVADIKLGIREVTADGNVVVPAFDTAVAHPSAIALYEEGGVRSFAIADSLGIVYVSSKGVAFRIAIDAPARDTLIHGHAGLGYPAGVAMIGPHGIVFSDPRTETIRFWSAGETRVIAGETVFDPEHRGGGYRDGAGEHARFFAPLGIARDIDGGIVIADSNNRRIRKLGAFDRREAIDPIYGGVPIPDPHARHVLLIGNSFTQWDASWRLSIAGELERELSEAARTPVQVIAVRSGGLSLPAQRSYIEEVCADLPIDYSVFIENTTTVLFSYDHTEGTGLQPLIPQAAHDLHEMARLLPHPENVLVAIHPFPWELSPAESTYHRLFEKIDEEWLYPVPSNHAELRASVAQAGLPLLDLWAVLGAAQRSADREPYFATNEEHFAEAGNRLVAHAIATRLLADPAWLR